MARDYDLIAIGGGAAGLVAAGMSALLGAKTALVEAHRLGGDCTWTGCVPSKALLKAAKLAQQIRTAGEYGMRGAHFEVDFPSVMARVRAVRERIYTAADAPPNFENLGIAVLRARARFVDPHTLELEDESGGRTRVSSRYFVVATGSRPKLPPPGIPWLTNETIFELRELPPRLLILGAGPIGIEMAQAFRRLGSDVTVTAPDERILPRDDPETAGMLQRILEAEGIRFLLGRKAVKSGEAAQGFEVRLDDGQTVQCDAALAAIGRDPNIEELGLDVAGVKTSTRGIEIDRRCRTSQRHIYASGDVTGRRLFTHMAEHMSKVAVTNALLRWPETFDENLVPWCTFTDPELAHAGASEADLKKRGAAYQAYRFPFDRIDRAVTEGADAGLVKVLANRPGKILGATILGANAGEMIAEWALAMTNGLTLAQVSRTLHPYPTYAFGNRQAADRWYTGKLTPRLIGLLRFVFGYRGRFVADRL